MELQQNKKRHFNWLDIMAIVGLLVYNIATISGVVRFGREMGDIGYSTILFAGSFFLCILFFLKWKGKLGKYSSIVTLMAIGLLLFIFYFSSFGRGPDYPWNGQFFFF